MVLLSVSRNLPPSVELTVTEELEIVVEKMTIEAELSEIINNPYPDPIIKSTILEGVIQRTV